MINIILNDRDSFYCLGMQTLFSAIFLDEFNDNITFTDDLNPQSVVMADVIVMGLSHGEISICHPLLHARKQNSLIIGLYEGMAPPHYDQLPLCFNNIIFINRTEPVQEIKRRVLRNWESNRILPMITRQWKCKDCRHKTLSPQQINVANYYYHGASAEQISQLLSISIKTVFTHKRMIMGKFNLHSDYQLFTLFNVIKALNNDTPDFLTVNRELKRA